MTEPLKPCELPCPKCGAPDIHREFWGKGITRQAEEYCKVTSKYARARGWSQESIRDHITHHCRTCQYRWQTLPLPKNPKPAGET